MLAALIATEPSFAPAEVEQFCPRVYPSVAMIPRFIRAVLVCCFLAGATVVAAQDKPAESAPGKRNQPANAEEPALRDAIKALAKAMEQGDRDTICKSMFAATPTEKKMLEAMANMAAQLAELNKAAIKAFGEEEAKSLTGDVGMEMGRIDDAQITIEGDTATVRYAVPSTNSSGTPADPAAPQEPDADAPPANPPLTLKRIEGHWRVPISELSKDTSEGEIDQRLSDLEAQSKIITELTGEIVKGKYRNADKAAEAWQGKMMQALAPKRTEDKKVEEKGSRRTGEANQADAPK